VATIIWDMPLQEFVNRLLALITQAQDLLTRESIVGQPEANTRSRLLDPLLDSLGYTPEYRPAEVAIKSLQSTTDWVDYFLLPEVNSHPAMMLEAKSLWEKGIWRQHKNQVLEYLRDYYIMIGTDQPVLWLILTNFREWHVIRLGDREPFWSFTMDDLEDREFAAQVYERLAREHLRSNRLQEFYSERQRRDLDARFLADLKTWRVILANGIRQNHPELSLAQLKEASQLILNRFLFSRLLEAYGQEPYYSIGSLYDFWQKTFQSKPFVELLRQKFEDTWESYNTELFTHSWIDELQIPTEYLKPLVLLDAEPSPSVAACLSGKPREYRSIYNYDFTTLTQDILGTAYEQFLAHELYDDRGTVRILENPQTRKREGIYYTPDYIVRRIVHQTLCPRIRPKIDRAIELLQQERYEEALREVNSVFEIKVLDPACGSGSFLLGAFEYICSEIQRYNKAVEDLRKQKWGDGLLNQLDQLLLRNPEEQIIVKMLYGVDLDPQAVSLAKLSLWTRLLRARPHYYGRRGATQARLPALTLNIRVGNSLIHSPAGLEALRVQRERAADLARIAKEVEKPESKRQEAADGLEALINEMNREVNPELAAFFASNASIANLLRALGREPTAELIEAVRMYLTEGEKSAGLREWDEQELERIRVKLSALPTAKEEVAVKRPFNWAVEFPDVFDPRLPEEQRGFDVVLGNPPYFNVDATFGHGAPELRWLKCAYPDIYTDKTDILFYFIRRAFQLLKPGGDLAFIVSRAFIQGDKAKNLRRFLAKRTTLLHILDFLGHKVFRSGIATCILHAQNGTPPSNHVLRVDNVLDFEAVRNVLEGNDPLAALPDEAITHVQIAQNELGEERWPLSPYAEIFERIDQAGVKLEDSHLGSFLKGIDTGLDKVFEGEFKEIFPDKWLRVRIPNSHIHKFGWEPGHTQILYITHDVAWKNLPESVARYLEKHRQALEERAGVIRGDCEWWQLHWPREGKGYNLFQPKIFFPRRAPENRFAVDETGEIGFKSDVAAFLKNPADSHDLYYICALLNSKVLEFRYRALGGLGKLTGRGMFEHFENQVGDLPIPVFENPQEHPDHQRLSELGREAHQLFRERYHVVMAFKSKSCGIDYKRKPIEFYHDPAGNYRDLIEWESPEPNREGHLLRLRVEPIAEGYVLWGEITEDEDWREGDREWVKLLVANIRDPALRRFLLAHALYLTEFDETFRHKQKLTSQLGNLVRAAMKALSAPVYDEDTARNLKIIETIERRVASEVGRADLEAILLRQAAVEREIDEIAYRLYGVERYRGIIEEALRVVL